MPWDGKDAKGNPLPAGSYSMSVDTGASAQAATVSFSGLVEAVELTDAGPRLRMGDLLIAPADIRTIGAQS